MDRNCAMQIVIIVADTSLSARRAWIEIIDDFEPSSTRKVALRKESVDRNINVSVIRRDDLAVALRKESVDRNVSPLRNPSAKTVALRKESVDRNMLFLLQLLSV